MRLDALAAGAILRVGRRLLRNTPIQRLPLVTTVYRQLFGRIHPRGTDLEVTYFGASYVIPSDDVTMAPSLTAGDYERAEFKALEAHLRPGMVVVDVGANVGLHTVFFARRVAPGGRVFALEPEPSNYEYLVRNVQRNGVSCVETAMLAAGSREGALTLHLTAGAAGGHSAAPVGSASIEVRVVRLDSFLEPRVSRVDLVKIDVEGFETQVLAGMADILERDRPILLIEFSPALVRRCGDSPEALLGRLQDLYPGIQLFHGAGRPPERLDARAARALLSATSGSRNLLCLPG